MPVLQNVLGGWGMGGGEGGGESLETTISWAGGLSPPLCFSSEPMVIATGMFYGGRKRPDSSGKREGGCINMISVERLK